jgi:hypothetical protein
LKEITQEKHCTNEQCKCTRIFREVSDWMGIIARHIHTLEDIFTKIQMLNEEIVVTTGSTGTVGEI